MVQPEPFLKPGHFVKFSPKWKEPWKGRFYMVLTTAQLSHEVHKILGVGADWLLELSDDNGFLPQTPDVMYEVLIGFKGNVLLHPKWPSTDYWPKWDRADKMAVDLSDPVKRYVMAYTEEDTPYESPRLRVYLLKDMNPVGLEFYNDSVEPEKVVVRIRANRCVIKPVEEMSTRLLEELRAHKRPFRYIPHYGDLTGVVVSAE